MVVIEGFSKSAVDKLEKVITFNFLGILMFNSLHTS